MMQFNVIRKKFLFGLILLFIVSMIYTMHFNYPKHKCNRDVKDIDQQGNILQQGYTSQQGNNTERKHFGIIQDISSNIKDQFTVVIMTYKREKQLIRALKHLNGLPSLNKTIIVWNDPEQSPPDFTYLNLTYEIQCIKQRKNSINNRFLIYEEIKTEAILCLDDDVFIEHRVIDLCFRVWKSDKYALVGIFPRSHKWSHTQQKWQYSFSSCPTSMVLLGGAFYNKIYNLKYRTWMAKEILQFVDDIFNCEDLAMNFLVTNLTGRPPIRVNYKTSAECQACSSNLSYRKSHYTDRSKCLNTLSTIYGYMPLLYTYNSVEIGEKVTKCLV